MPPGESVPRVVNNKRWSGCVARWTAVPIRDTQTVEKVSTVDSECVKDNDNRDRYQKR